MGVLILSIMEQFTAIVVTAAGAKQVIGVGLRMMGVGCGVSDGAGAQTEEWSHPQGDICPCCARPFLRPCGKVRPDGVV